MLRRGFIGSLLGGLFGIGATARAVGSSSPTMSRSGDLSWIPVGAMWICGHDRHLAISLCPETGEVSTQFYRNLDQCLGNIEWTHWHRGDGQNTREVHVYRLGLPKFEREEVCVIRLPRIAGKEGSTSGLSNHRMLEPFVPDPQSLSFMPRS